MKALHRTSAPAILVAVVLLLTSSLRPSVAAADCETFRVCETLKV